MDNSVRPNSDIDFLCDILKGYDKGQECPKDMLVLKMCALSYKEIGSKVSCAIAKLRKNHDMVFRTERNTIKRLTDEEITNDTSDTKRINHTAKRRQKKLTCVDRNALAAETKYRYDASLMLASVQETLSGESAVRLLENSQRSGRPLVTIGQTLELFK